MSWYQSTGQLTDYRQLPKVELHRHLEGSLRLDTMLDIARSYGMTIPMRGGLNTLVQMQREEPLTFSNFLAKFQTLRLFFRSPEVITRVTREAIEDAALDNVRYMELRFTPVALGRLESFPPGEVIDWVCSAARQASADFHIDTRLIISVNRHESVELAEEVLRTAAERISKGVVGFDLAGNEAQFPAAPFAGVIREARQSGLKLTIHAGEWSGAANVREAIEDLHTERIGHGVRALEDPAVVAMAAERGIPFEVCITSNYHTGVVPALSQHPLASLLNAGVNVTLNTDDPSISRISLSDEYRTACMQLGLPRLMLLDRILAGVQASFLPAEEKQQLLDHVKTEFQILGLPV